MTRSRLCTQLAALAFAGAALSPAVASAAGPNAITGAANAVKETTATLTGTVNPHGTNTTYYFEYGATTAYGQRTPGRSAGNGTAGITVRAFLTGLTGGARYHYRVVAVGGGSTTMGADRAFTTVTPIAPEPSKLALARATIYSVSNLIDILAPISHRASGTASLELYAAHQVHRWSAQVDSTDGWIRSRVSLPPAQAALGTGILTIRYPGDADTRPQTVRLRAANVHADLNAQRPTLVAGHLRASGTVAAAAHGVVRVQLEYFSTGHTTTLEKYATIANGQWSLDYALSPTEQAAIAARRGTVHSYILFTGYLPARMRGEMQAYEVLGAPGA